ncbi:MAG: hypothetical protein MJZ00_08125 [Paludibacteraceae bacterium]|nr:hypothetical protein [Paludibacteraceae bacterium]
MKSIMYFLGMAFAMCCCSSKQEPVEAAAQSESEKDSNVNHFYSFYDFSKEDPGCEFSGFSGDESFGRWSSGDTSTIDLMTAPMAEFTARLDVHRIGTEGEPIEFDVLVNSEPVSHVSTNGHESVYVNVSKENVGADGSARLMLAFKNAAKPSKYNPESKDPRKLGIALSSVTVYGYSMK